MTKKKTLGERMERIETNIEEMKSDIKEIKDAFLNLNCIFANKWVEKLVIGLLISMGAGLTVLIIKLFL